MTPDNLEIVEISVPVPFGFIRGKKWLNHTDAQGTTGDEEYERMIAIHGWQDNCGTFDTLIPLIIAGRNMVIIAVDLPGHGLSSHFPAGCPYSDLNYAMDINRVMKFFNWKKVSLMGHSMGGYVSIFFASLFPDLVDKVISLDIIKPLTFKSDDLSKSTANAVETFLAIENKLASSEAQPTYTCEDGMKRLIQAHAKLGVLSKEAAEILMKRGSKPAAKNGPKRSDNQEEEQQSEEKESHQESPQEIVFTRDPRLRAIFFTRLDTMTVKAYLTNIKCKLLVIKANDGIKLDEDEVTDEFIKVYRKNCSSFTYAKIEGQHHVHLCQPQLVSPVITSFLNSKLEPMTKTDLDKPLNGPANGLTSNGTKPNGNVKHSQVKVPDGETTKKVLNVDDVIYARVN